MTNNKSNTNQLITIFILMTLAVGCFIAGNYFSIPVLIYSSIGLLIFLPVITLLLRSSSRIIGKEIAKESEEVEGFPDAYFIVNPHTGLTTFASEEAVELFQAKSVAELLSIDLTGLFSDGSKDEQRKKIKKGIGESGVVKISGNFLRLNGSHFSGTMEIRKKGSGPIYSLFVRFVPAEHILEIKSEVNDFFSNSSQAMLVLGLDLKVSNVNQSFVKLSGYRTDDVVAESLFFFVFPSEQAVLNKAIRSVLRSENISLKADVRIVRHNHEVIWTSVSLSAIKNEIGNPKSVLLSFEDISLKKKSERLLVDINSRLSSFIENAEYSIVSLDARHTVLLVNKKLSDQLFALTGIVIEKGFNLLDILPEAFQKEYIEFHKRAFQGEGFIAERNLNIAGRQRYTELIFSPVKDESGKVISITILGHDITERKKLEVELRKSKEDAENTAQAKSGFLATMSHEIRTPLNGVIGMGRLLSQTSLNKKQQEFVDSILLSGEALMTVINDILDYSKIESAKMQLEHKPFAIKRCIEETFDLLSSKAIEKGLSLHYSIGRSVPPFIYGDITRVRQVLMNLVSNAVKFTLKGSITISVELLQQQGDQIELKFHVKDTGVGIPKDKIGRLFQAFSQAEASTARTYGGTGLGLAISKNLVQLMGGTIWVESQEGLGSDFQFTIATEVVPKAEIPKIREAGTSKLVNSKVILISDNATESGVYANYFTRWGMVPVQVSGQNIVDRELIESKDVNIVLIDAELISNKPYDVAARIRGMRRKNDLPIVLFNVDETHEIFFDYTDEVFSAVIPKNVDRSKVLDILIGVFSVEDHQRSRNIQQVKGSGQKLSDLFPANILIAEDNSVNQKLAKNIFEGLGYQPIIVSNGLEVLNEIKNKKYDFIFMDVQMPEMDGLEASRNIQRVNLTSRPIIIAMTAFALEGDKEKCLEAGMDDYISKPFMVEEIIGKIEKWKTNNSNNMRATNSGPVITTRPIINEQTVERLRQMTSSADPTFFNQVLQMFLDQSSEIINQLNTAVGNLEASNIASLAHKLKGSALNVGASAMAEICREMEIDAKDGMLDKSAIQLTELKLYFDQTKEAVKRLL